MTESNHVPEYGRAADVHRIFGLKRGTLYHLLTTGKIRGALVHAKGEKSGVRLFDLASIRAYINSHMQGGAQ